MGVGKDCSEEKGVGAVLRKGCKGDFKVSPGQYLTYLTCLKEHRQSVSIDIHSYNTAVLIEKAILALCYTRKRGWGMTDSV
jgi:hypothetical protein